MEPEVIHVPKPDNTPRPETAVGEGLINPPETQYPLPITRGPKLPWVGNL